MKTVSYFSIIIFTLLIVSSIRTDSLQQNPSIEVTVNTSPEEFWWTSAELVSQEFDTDQGYIEIKIDDNDNIHLLMYSTTDLLSSGSDRDIFYKMYDSSTKSWTTLELVTTESTSASELPQIDIDSSGTVHVLWKDFTDMLGAGSDSDLFYRQKTSSGWSTVELVSVDSTGVSNYPSMRLDSNGVVHVAWEDTTDYLGSGTDYDILYCHRFSNGTWSSAEVVSDLSDSNSDRVSLVIDNNNGVNIVWCDYSDILSAGADKDIFYRKLNSDLTTWSSIILLSPESTSSSFDPYITTDTIGNLYLAWYDGTDLYGSGTDYDVFYKAYDAQTFSWGNVEVVSTESTSSSFSIRTYTDDNFLYVVYQDQTDLGAPMLDNIFFKYRNLETDTWSSLHVITSEVSGSSQAPRVAGDSLGHVYVLWIDWTPDYLSSGTDSDHFMRKFVGKPSVPLLNEIIPGNLPVGNVSLSWTMVKDATSYEIYREETQFTSLSGLTPIDTTTSSDYDDEIVSTGNYYYVIVAVNDYGKSDMSNIAFVEIIEEGSIGLFASLNYGEIIIIGGIVLGLQLIFSLITYSLINAKVNSLATKPAKGKKK